MTIAEQTSFLDVGQARAPGGSPTCGWDVSVIGFGDPLSPRTSSGYARGLCQALSQYGALRNTYSARQVYPTDVLRGAVGVRLFSRGLVGKQFHPYVRRAWIWSPRGAELLSERVEKLVRAAGDRGRFLQVGTLVTLPDELGPHYMRTDMTIAQARRAGFFDVARLSGRRLDRAEELQAQIVSTAAGLFAASEWVAQSLHHDCGVPRERLHLLYPSAQEWVMELRPPAPLPSSSSRREILFVGLDWKRKGGPLLVEAFRLLSRDLPDVRLRIVGCSPPIRHPAVHVEGRLDRRDPRQLSRLMECYRMAACFCLPSEFEPFGISFIEAALQGVPSVSIDLGSRHEAIVDGVTGRLAAEPTPEELAHALSDVLADLNRARQLGEAARARARRLFSWNAAVTTIEGTFLPRTKRTSTLR